MKKALIAALLLALGAALGGTALRMPLANAAGSIPTMLVGNDSQHALPVREQNLDAGGNIRVHDDGVLRVAPEGENRLLLEHHFTETREAVTLDVSGYREIRVAFDRCGLDAQGRGVHLELYQVTPAGRRYALDRTTVSCAGPLSQAYEVPGGTVELTVGDLAAPEFWIAVYGRAS